LGAVASGEEYDVTAKLLLATDEGSVLSYEVNVDTNRESGAPVIRQSFATAPLPPSKTLAVSWGAREGEKCFYASYSDKAVRKFNENRQVVWNI
jgi:hypothetical protein